jgi:hypothetical protein
MLKKCPKCKSIYTDQTLNFCLSDGTPLIIESGGEKTLEFSHKQSEETLVFPSKTVGNLFNQETKVGQKQTENFQNFNNKPKTRFWLFFTLGIFSVLIVGTGIFLGFYFGGSFLNFQKTSTGSTNSKPESNVIESSANSNNTTGFSADSSTPTPTSNQISYKVVGVANNDFLYIRPSAGNLKVKVGSIPPNGKGVIVTGSGKKVGKSVWVPILYKGKKGWVNSRFLAMEK